MPITAVLDGELTNVYLCYYRQVDYIFVLSGQKGGSKMPRNFFQRIVFTFFGVLLMAAVMAIFNKYLVLGSFSAEMLMQAAAAFCQKAPAAFVLQLFFVQNFAERQMEKYKTNSIIVNYCIRTGFTVLLMCPAMCVYSNVINMFSLHWSLLKTLQSIVVKMPVNWIFAFCVQVWILGPVNRCIFRRIFAENQAS